MAKAGIFRFFRAGGVAQAVLDRGEDLWELAHLDQKLWVALACPVVGLEFDERTLALIDQNHDHRIRATELIAAVQWISHRLSDPDELTHPDEPLALSSLRRDNEEGELLHRTAKALLARLGRGEQDALSLDDALDGLKLFRNTLENGDGIVPAQAIEAPELKRLAELILAGSPGRTDASGNPGIDLQGTADFFAAVRRYQDWARGRATSLVAPFGEASQAADEALQAVEDKLADYFARCKVAAFDPKALEALQAASETYVELTRQTLDLSASVLKELPIAPIGAGHTLSLVTHVNPAWSSALDTFRMVVVQAMFGGDGTTLTENDFRAIRTALEPYRAWKFAKPAIPWNEPDTDLVLELASAHAEADLVALIEADQRAAPMASALEDVERLVRYKRDLLRLANNFVNFRDFYRPPGLAAFQVGTLYIDERALKLVLRVNDPAKHMQMGGEAEAFLLYCDVTREGASKMSIVAVVTDGDVDNLTVGRNGVFYDRQGRDWDAVVTRVVQNPIGIRQAFWAPYKKIVRLVEDQIQKRAADAEAKADTDLTAKTQALPIGAAGPAAAPPAPTPPKKLDVGVVAALGVAVGGITAALGVLVQAFVGLGPWMPLGIVGALLAISGPAMAVAWLKLRRRNIGPLLEANGWAVNVLPRINVSLGQALTSLAELPPGAYRQMSLDPYAERKVHWGRWLFLILLLGTIGAWATGHLDSHLPKELKSTEHIPR